MKVEALFWSLVAFSGTSGQCSSCLLMCPSHVGKLSEDAPGKFNGVKCHFYGPKNLWKNGSNLNLQTPFYPSFYISVYIDKKLYNLWSLEMINHRHYDETYIKTIFERRFFFGDDEEWIKKWDRKWESVWQDMANIQKQINLYFQELKFARGDQQAQIKQYTPNVKTLLTNWLETSKGWDQFTGYFLIDGDHIKNDFLWKKSFGKICRKMRIKLREEGAVFQIGFLNRNFYLDENRPGVIHREDDWTYRWLCPPEWAVNDSAVRITPQTESYESLLYYYCDPMPEETGTSTRKGIKPCFYLPITGRKIPATYPFAKFTLSQILDVILEQFNPEDPGIIDLYISPEYEKKLLYSGGPVTSGTAAVVTVNFRYYTGMSRELLGSTGFRFKFLSRNRIKIRDC